MIAKLRDLLFGPEDEKPVTMRSLDRRITRVEALLVLVVLANGREGVATLAALIDTAEAAVASVTQP